MNTTITATMRFACHTEQERLDRALSSRLGTTDEYRLARALRHATGWESFPDSFIGEQIDAAEQLIRSVAAGQPDPVCIDWVLSLARENHSPRRFV